jgi:hypothetical protein
MYDKDRVEDAKANVYYYMEKLIIEAEIAGNRELSRKLRALSKDL